MPPASFLPCPPPDAYRPVSLRLGHAVVDAAAPAGWAVRSAAGTVDHLDRTGELRLRFRIEPAQDGELTERVDAFGRLSGAVVAVLVPPHRPGGDRWEAVWTVDLADRRQPRHLVAHGYLTGGVLLTVCSSAPAGAQRVARAVHDAAVADLRLWVPEPSPVPGPAGGSEPARVAGHGPEHF